MAHETLEELCNRLIGLATAERDALRSEVARLRGLLRDIVAQSDGEEFTADPLDAARAALVETGGDHAP